MTQDEALQWLESLPQGYALHKYPDGNYRVMVEHKSKYQSGCKAVFSDAVLELKNKIESTAKPLPVVES